MNRNILRYLSLEILDARAGESSIMLSKYFLSIGMFHHIFQAIKDLCGHNYKLQLAWRLKPSSGEQKNDNDKRCFPASKLTRTKHI